MYIVLVSLSFLLSLATLTLSVLALFAISGTEMLVAAKFTLLCWTIGLGVIVLLMWIILHAYRAKKGM
jgi:hypothetical protein